MGRVRIGLISHIKTYVNWVGGLKSIELCGLARLWGELSVRAQAVGVVIPTADGLIAATALHHGLHIMTRNTRHFKAAGVLILDPWAK